MFVRDWLKWWASSKTGLSLIQRNNLKMSLVSVAIVLLDKICSQKINMHRPNNLRQTIQRIIATVTLADRAESREGWLIFEATNLLRGPA